MTAREKLVASKTYYIRPDFGKWKRIYRSRGRGRRKRVKWAPAY